MSYLVLARKYRPQRFSELVGQEHVARTLTNAIAAGRVHHAFLFTGARGVGKTSAARILAKSLCCVNGPTAEPCGTCELCEEIAAGRAVDIFEIDGASNTGVDDVRALREGVRYLPARARRKIYIIDEVHMLSTSAFNALLKTLEEPPAHVVFVFATTEVHKIPTTILSRCQRYDFKLIPTARLTEHLAGILEAESIPFDPDAVRLLARLAAGSVRDALSLLDQVIAYVGDGKLSAAAAVEVLGVADRALLIDLCGAVLARDAGAALRALAAAADRGVDLAQLARSLLGFLRDLEVVATVPDPGELVDASAEELAELQRLAARAGDGLARALFDRWARVTEDAARSQAARMVYEMGLCDLARAEPLLPLGDLLDRLEDLEGRLGSGAPGPVRPGGAPAAGGPPSGAVRGPSEPAARGPAAPVRAAAPAAAAPRVPAAAGSPEPPSPAGTVSAADAWRRALIHLQEKRPRIAGILAHAEVGDVSGSRMELRFESKFAVEQAERCRADIEGVLSSCFGQPTKVHMVVGAGAHPAVLRSEVRQAHDEEEADRRRRENEAREHPMIRKAQDLFGVTPREIKT